MKTYQCHKQVQAAKITAAERHADGELTVILSHDGCAHRVKHPEAGRFRVTEEDLGYYVVYEDGYISWSPSAVFEAGYSEITA